MDAEKMSRELDYRVGDIVQIRPDGYKYSGRFGMIIGINSYKQKSGKGESLAYMIKLSDKESVSAQCYRIRLVREAGRDEDLPESKSQFLPVSGYRF